MNSIPDIATPIANGTEILFRFLWLRTGQGRLWLGWLFHRKSVLLTYFENIRQDLNNEVPAYLCWDAKYYYKTTINDGDVNFDKTPLLASQLDVDTSIISKVERGNGQIKKEKIPLLAQIRKAGVEELQTLFLADQLYYLVQGEPMADEALKSVSKKIKKGK